MSKFSNKDPNTVAHRQAVNVIKQVQGKVIKSVGTARNYEQALSQAALFANKHLNCGLRELTPKLAEQYLHERAVTVSQKTLDMDRQALQCMMRHVSKQINVKATLSIVKSEHQQQLRSRSYTPHQVQLIKQRQNEKNGLSTQIAHAAGLRAHELYTLRLINERQPDIRPSLPEKFNEREGARYTVAGKGGLTREVQIPYVLAEQLERHRLETPKIITDRQIHYQIHYDIAAGKAWSNSFSAASQRTLGWTEGAHGLRHSYAQERITELQQIMPYERALEVVSQEMGHFRSDITEIYLR